MLDDFLLDCYVDKMADSESTILHSQNKSVDLSDLASSLLKLEEQIPNFSSPAIRPGSQLSEKIVFKDKEDNTVSAYPVIVDFRRLLQLHKNTNHVQDSNVISGIPNNDLLHAVVGLYDIALSEMTLDVLYATVCEKWSRTIVLVQDSKDALIDTEVRKKEKLLKKQKKEEKDEFDEKKDEVQDEKDDNDEEDNSKDVYEEEEGQPSKFEFVFSDADDDEDEDEEEDEDDSDNEEDFSTGINTFIKSACKRRKLRNESEIVISECHIGVENRIIGCLTFEKKYVRHRERVIHLTILTVRPRYRKYGIGKYLLSQVLDPDVAGQYEAVVVHADNGAVEFFNKFGFSDDVVLNSRWSELAEQFTNCTLMCYLPGFTGHTVLSTINLPGLEVYEMDQELKKWKDKTLECYQAEVTCVMRMKREILNLQKKVKSQDDLIKMLAFNNEKIKQEKLVIEKELLSYKLSRTHDSLKGLAIHEGTGDEISTEDLINELQQQVDKMDRSKRILENGSKLSLGDMELDDYSRVPLKSPPYDHMLDAAVFYDTTQQFKEAMHSDPNIKIQYEVTSINKSTVDREIRDIYTKHNRMLHDCNMVTQLYYCGGLLQPHRLHNIIHNGFTEEDYSHGEFGTGLYFSKYPSKAAQFSPMGKLVLAEVGLGSVQTVTKPDRSRLKPSDGWDSIIVPGRLSKSDNSTSTAMYNQEYVIFDYKQILPLCIINYEIAKVSS